MLFREGYLDFKGGNSMLKVYLGDVLKNKKFYASFLVVDDDYIDFVLDGPKYIHLNENILALHNGDMKVGTLILNGRICDVDSVTNEDIDTIMSFFIKISMLLNKIGTDLSVAREVLGSDSIVVPLIVSSDYIEGFLEKYNLKENELENFSKKLWNILRLF